LHVSATVLNQYCVLDIGAFGERLGGKNIGAPRAEHDKIGIAINTQPLNKQLLMRTKVVFAFKPSSTEHRQNAIIADGLRLTQPGLATFEFVV
jgi:hypothetical protein